MNYFAAGPTKDTFLTIARIVIGISVICTYPIDCMVAVNAIRRMLRRYKWQRKQAYGRGRLNDSMHAERCTDVSSLATIDDPQSSLGSPDSNAEHGAAHDGPDFQTRSYSFRQTAASALMADSEVDMRLLREPSIFQVMESKPTLFMRLKEMSTIVGDLLVCLL